MTTRRVPVRAVMIGSVAMLALAAPAAVAQSPAAEPLTVKAVYSSVIEEPWDGVIHAALEAEAAAGRISHTYQDNIGYDGQMEFVLQEVASEGPDIIFGDSFGNEEAVRRAAAQFPDIPFVFGSGGGPAEPNFSVFDNWIHEPAYLAGMLAGGLTESNTIGVVAGYPVPEVNRITNAFISGAQAQNPDVNVVVTFINSWFDPATAKEAAVAQIGQGADVLYAERAGVIEAAVEAGIPVIGNMADQQELGPQNVVTSVMWNMTPTVEYVVDQVLAGAYTAQDLKDFTMMAKGGADLAPINPALNVPADLAAAVEAKKADILSGLFRVDINESQPAGSTIVGQ
jgi:basic membrane lipoprotein Med (substrate-binding protein (PBP1-ABC) superfamily)